MLLRTKLASMCSRPLTTTCLMSPRTSCASFHKTARDNSKTANFSSITARGTLPIQNKPVLLWLKNPALKQRTILDGVTKFEGVSVPKNSIHSRRGDDEDKVKRRHPEISPEPFPGWSTVYRFPYIITMAVLCRFKIYQTALTALCVPSCGLMLLSGQTDVFTFGVITGICGLASVMLLVSGEIFRRTVGFIYLSPDKQQVIISHLSWWGKRTDFRVDISEIMMPEEFNESMDDAFWRIRFYGDEDEFFFISTKFGGIKDLKDFQHIFGK